MINEKFSKFIEFCKRKAHAYGEDAAYGGSFSDGGKSDLEAKIECFVAGLEGRIPDVLRSHEIEFNIKTDPEYAEYLRMKKKFG